ncbi:MAG TPA: RIP metalloprotease RseP [Rickettsiales bacterium]|nr:RIP metalloprotease RseP [Rickettsiales bacterium]
MEIVFTILQNFFAFILILSILVFVHEYGHYLGCRICGVKVDSFSIGMGKEIFGWTDKNDVRWKVSILPFGGYLKMFGDDDIASGKADKNLLENMTEEDKEVSFYFQNVYKKFLIVFFGPLFNLLFAILLLTVVVKHNGVSDLKPIIGSVVANSPAYNAGLQENDLIIEINNKKVDSFSDVAHTVVINNLKPLKVKILRGSQEIVKDIQPKLIENKDMFGNDVKTPSIGVVSISNENKKLNMVQSFVEANKTVYKMCKDTLVVLGQMITGNRNTDGIGGPLKIAKYSAQSFEGGLMMVLYFMALISANLGLMNLLPIPVLDGGHLMFFIVEIIIGKPIPEKLQDKLLKFGFAVLVFIMIFATINDIRGFF